MREEQGRGRRRSLSPARDAGPRGRRPGAGSRGGRRRAEPVPPPRSGRVSSLHRRPAEASPPRGPRLPPDHQPSGWDPCGSAAARAARRGRAGRRGTSRPRRWSAPGPLPHLDGAVSEHLGYERGLVSDGESRHSCHRVGKYPTVLWSCQTLGHQEERTDGGLGDGPFLGKSIAHLLVFGQHDPSAPTHFSNPAVVRGVSGEITFVRFNLRSGSTQSVGHIVAAQFSRYEECKGRQARRGWSRSVPLLRFPRVSADNPWPDALCFRRRGSAPR